MEKHKKITKALIIIALIIGVGALIAAIGGRTQHYLTASMMLGVAVMFKLVEFDNEENDKYDE